MNRKTSRTHSVIPPRILFTIIGAFLLLFIVSIILTTMGDDTVGTQRVDINAVADHIRAGDVTEINQRNGIQMIILLNDGEKLVYFRPANGTITDALSTAGIDSETLSTIKFTIGRPSNALETAGDVLRLIGLGGLGITVILAYFQRRQYVMNTRG